MSKRFIVFTFILICLSSLLFAVDSKSATLQLSMTSENYIFGFADSLANAKNGVETSTFTIDGVNKTMYFFWKIMVPGKMKITLSSNGPLKNTSGTPKDYQKIDYQIDVACSTEPGWWPDGASLTGTTCCDCFPAIAVRIGSSYLAVPGVNISTGENIFTSFNELGSST